MIDVERCIKDGLQNGKVSRGLEALLLAIEDDCRLSETPPLEQKAWAERVIEGMDWLAPLEAQNPPE